MSVFAVTNNRGSALGMALTFTALCTLLSFSIIEVLQAGNKLKAQSTSELSMRLFVSTLRHALNDPTLCPTILGQGQNTVTTALNSVSNITFNYIDGNTEETMTLIEDFAQTISGTVGKAGDEERLKLHVAAVVVSNFTNHLYALAEDYCKKENIDFKLLAPVIKETAQRVETYSPASVQTGPALRNDVFTLDKHLRLLSNHPKLKYIYLKLTDSIIKG